MSDYAFDPTQWLVSGVRQLQAYIHDKIIEQTGGSSDKLVVELGFPNTESWTKTSPLDYALIHLESDNIDAKAIGLGGAYVYEWTENEPIEDVEQPDSVTSSEAGWYEINFDVGIWCSAQEGGVTGRVELTQALTNLFGTIGARARFNAATDGLTVVSFSHGTDALDRVNDLPIWRRVGMELVIRMFSKSPGETTYVLDVDQLTQDQNLTIIGSDGSSEPVN